jgi:hypothetical protein
MIDKLYQKKTVSNINYLFWMITVFVIFAPIFLSFESINKLSFNYIKYPAVSKDYLPLFTLPISFFFIIPFILLGLLNFYKDVEIFILLVFVLISSINFFFYQDLLILSLLAKISLPILALLGFEIYFKKKFQLKKKIINKVIKEYNYSFVLIFTMIFIITMISPYYLKSKYDWLINGITIFNYFQYFCLTFILLLGMLIEYKQQYIFLLFYILSFYLSYLTSNITHFILIVVFGIFCVFSFLKKRYLIFLSKIFIIFIFFIFFSYPFFITFFYSDLLQTGLFNNYSIFGRLYEINKFLSNLSFIEFLTPIKLSLINVSKFYHNELIVITSALGFPGAFLFYFVLFKRIWLISKYYPHTSVAISLYCILSGVVITVNLHPYTFIILSFFISYYYVLSKIKLQQSL